MGQELPKGEVGEEKGALKRGPLLDSTRGYREEAAAAWDHARVKSGSPEQRRRRESNYKLMFMLSSRFRRGSLA